MMQQLLILLDWIGSNALNHIHKALASIGKKNDVTCMTLALGTHGIVAVPSVQMCVRHGSLLSCWILPGEAGQAWVILEETIVHLALMKLTASTTSMHQGGCSQPGRGGAEPLTCLKLRAW